MSTYFHSLFTTGMQESLQSEVTMQGVDPECCERVLRLLYASLMRTLVVTAACCNARTLPTALPSGIT